MIDFETKKKLATLNGTLDDLYEEEIVTRIRKRYSPNAETALSRQRDTKPEEWAEYYAYCEQCKAEAKAAVYG